MSDSPTVVRLSGGLGNQMFQYAFGKVVSERNGSQLYFDSRFLRKARTRRELGLTGFQLRYAEATSESLSKFEIPESRISSSPLRYFAQQAENRLEKVVIEPGWGYYPEFVRQYPNGCYLIGYWQSFDYFKEIRNDLKTCFEIEVPLESHTRKLLRKIELARSICVNVRRGDFAKDRKTRNFHGLMPLDYYLRGLEKLKESNRFDRVYIFSDEPEWCRLNFPTGSYDHVVEHSHAGPHFSHYLHLMAHCTGFVIPNSTFGWWAAWLSAAREKDIVAPSRWFKAQRNTDCLIPSTWQRV